ncbi:MAG: hypothetical protein Q8K64_05605 [Sediminibacterium sp.]|nr:MAG: FkbM family [Chitinophagaceae bacterium]MDP1842878.1 hypothetical protein [Sediminibacterium sp.]
MRTYLLKLRRILLSILVPELYWPKSVNINGAEIAIRNEPFSFGTKWILKKKNYEGAEINLVSKILKGGESILEMGTSIGVLTRVMSKLVGEKGKIITIECNEDLYNSCLRWSKQNTNVQLIRGYGFPIFSAPTDLTIEGYSDDLGSLGSRVDFSLQGSDTANNEYIYDIETIEKRFNFAPSVLVVDVEGSEEIILNQNFTLPNYIKYIIIELHSGMYLHKLESQNSIIQAIKNAGFELIEKIADSYLFERR